MSNPSNSPGFIISDSRTGEIYPVSSMAASMIAFGTLSGTLGAVSGGIPYAVERAWKAPVGARTRHAFTGMRIGGSRLAILFGLAGFAYTPIYLCVGKTGLKDENRKLAQYFFHRASTISTKLSSINWILQANHS
ncbi:hypothetical protein LENED_001796 [Lentinula edodes]|uniref:Uncharacterized protein n=1 Tax=Lentinula edodes TaxID=5353 RepID=A0A1Q3DZW1_LENED|nr:hypothetical protein LENED_001796 [Lentinula edodes]